VGELAVGTGLVCSPRGLVGADCASLSGGAAAPFRGAEESNGA
jgi:hypothetical protein